MKLLLRILLVLCMLAASGLTSSGDGVGCVRISLRGDIGSDSLEQLMALATQHGWIVLKTPGYIYVDVKGSFSASQAIKTLSNWHRCRIDSDSGDSSSFGCDLLQFSGQLLAGPVTADNGLKLTCRLRHCGRGLEGSFSGLCHVQAGGLIFDNESCTSKISCFLHSRRMFVRIGQGMRAPPYLI